MICDTIFRLLKEKNMTQKEFSEKTGIPQGTISDWKRKQLNPSADKLVVIAKALQVTVDQLLGNEEADAADYVVHLTGEEWTLIDKFRSFERSQQDRMLDYALGMAKVGQNQEKEEVILEAPKSEAVVFARNKAMVLKLRKLSRLGRLRLDETEHANGRNLHLLRYLDYVGLDRLEYIRQYLSNLQPFMISEFVSQETYDQVICVLDQYYRISVYIKVDTTKREEIIVSFRENHKNGIAKRNPEKLRDEYVYIMPDSLGSRSGDIYTVNFFLTRGVRSFPINAPAHKYDEDGFLVRYQYINNALVDICNRYLEDLYTSDLDFSQIELFSSLTQLSFTSYGKDAFSNISMLVDSILIQKNAIGKQISDSALCIYCGQLSLEESQKKELLDTLKERFSVNSVRALPVILERIETNLQY